MAVLALLSLRALDFTIGPLAKASGETGNPA